MAEITTGIKAILSSPLVYSSFQRIMGARDDRQNFVDRLIKPVSGMKILDLGCGPADILEHLPDVDYFGVDISQSYIDQAQKKFGDRGHFECRQLQIEDLKDIPPVDVVIAIGLLHHLDDDIAINMIRLAWSALKSQGRLLTLDPCLDDKQSSIARFLVKSDRGQNVRDRSGYHSIANKFFPSVSSYVRHKTWIPYTHCLMECRK